MVITTARPAGARQLVQLLGGVQQQVGHRSPPSDSVSASTPSRSSASSGLSRPCARARSAVVRAIARYAGDRAGRVPAQLRDVRGDRTGVAAGHRPGQGGVTGAQGVVEGRAEQRAEHPVGVLDPGLGQQLHRLGDQGDQVVRAEGEGRVVERTVLLRDPLGLPAHLDDQGLGGQPQLLGGGDAEGAAGEPLHVDLGAGEGHRRVQGQRQGARAARRVEHGGPVPPGGVHEELSGPDRAGLGEALHEGGSASSGTVSSTRSASSSTCAGGTSGTSGSIRAARRTDASETPETATGRCPACWSARGQRGTDPAGPDDADGEPGRAWLL